MTTQINPNDLASKLPEYICHKHVHAAKITGVTPINEKDGTVEIILGEISVKLSCSTFSRDWPSVGDYLVVYGDGYISRSPQTAFLSGYKEALPYEHIEYDNGMFAGGYGRQPRLDHDGSPAIKVNGVPLPENHVSDEQLDALGIAHGRVKVTGLSPVTYLGIELDPPAST